MKKLEATIRKSKFKEVKRALIEGGFNSFNYHLTRCISKESEKRYYRGVEFDSKATERISLSIYVENKKIDDVMNIIKSSGNSGDSGDSLIAIFNANLAYKLLGDENGDKLIEII